MLKCLSVVFVFYIYQTENYYVYHEEIYICRAMRYIDSCRAS